MIGPYASIGANAVIRNAVLSDVIVETGRSIDGVVVGTIAHRRQGSGDRPDRRPQCRRQQRGNVVTENGQRRCPRMPGSSCRSRSMPKRSSRSRSCFRDSASTKASPSISPLPRKPTATISPWTCRGPLPSVPSLPPPTFVPERLKRSALPSGTWAGCAGRRTQGLRAARGRMGRRLEGALPAAARRQARRRAAALV